jgi:hypothetical protein
MENMAVTSLTCGTIKRMTFRKWSFHIAALLCSAAAEANAVIYSTIATLSGGFVCFAYIFKDIMLKQL